MSLIDQIAQALGFSRGAEADISFSPIIGRLAPDMKELEALKAYRGWVYACTQAIAQEIAAMDLTLERKSGEDWKEVPTHPVIDLLNKVNPYMSRHELLESTSSFEDLAGEAFWYVVRPGNGAIFGQPQELWPLRPDRMIVVPNKQTFVSGYIYRNPDNGTEIPLAPAEVIHHKRFNPLNPYRGLSTVMAAAIAIDTDRYAAEWNRNFFFNSAQPSGVLETDQELTDTQFKRLEAQWKDRYGGTANAHKVAILEKGLKYNRMSLTQVEADFLEQRRFNRDEILGLFRVPKAVLGITEDVNRANAEATDYMFGARVIRPRMARLVNTLNEYLLPMFGLDQVNYRLNFKDPVPQNRELEAKLLQGSVNVYRTVNEARAEQGLPNLPGGDDLFVPATMVPLAAASAQSTGDSPKPAPAPAGKDASKKKDSSPPKLLRVLMTSKEPTYP